MAKKIYCIANWKMYKTARQATDYIEELLDKVEGSKVHIYLAVPYTSIAPAAHYAKETPIVIGAQNMNDAREGAFTGEIASLMLKEAGAHFVLIGHSERRQLFGEDLKMIHNKLIRALQDDLQPVLCVGESASERGRGKTQEVLEQQLLSALEKVPEEEAAKLLIAYEPLWAIGTGKRGSAKQIQEAHAICRKCLAERFGAKIAKAIPILYGGSVNADNVAEIAAEKEVSGVLVGGASLDPEQFSQIIHNIERGQPARPRKPSKREKRE